MHKQVILIITVHFLLRIDSENKRYSFLRGTATAIDLHPAGEKPKYTMHAHSVESRTATFHKAP